MSIQEELIAGLQEKAPSAKVYQNISLDSKRGKGRKADLLVLHKTGVYPIFIREYEGMLYAEEDSRYWILRTNAGEGDYFENPIAEAAKAAESLALKCRSAAEFIQPIVIYGEATKIVELKRTKDQIMFCGKDYFLATMMCKEYEEELIDPAMRDILVKQFTMLQMLSK